jgi:hypothetical protein
MHDKDIPELDARGLRKFGLTTGAIVAVLFGALIPWAFGLHYPKWPWVLAGVLGLWALAAPATLHPVYLGWMRRRFEPDAASYRQPPSRTLQSKHMENPF